MNTQASAWQREDAADGIAWLTLDKPGGSTNVLSRDILVELDGHLAALRANPPTGVVIRSGKTSGFIAGADVKEFVQLENAEQAYELVRAAHRILDHLQTLPCPTVCIINGFALGGGCELAMACTLRVAADTARLGQPEVNLGIPPGFAGTQRLSRLVGKGAALDLLLTGRHVTADEALRIGLVNRVVPLADLEAEGVQWADEILDMSPTAIRFLKSAFLVATDGLAGLQEFAGNATGLYYTTDEAHEGSTAFLEKRRPDYRKYPRRP